MTRRIIIGLVLLSFTTLGVFGLWYLGFFQQTSPYRYQTALDGYNQLTADNPAFVSAIQLQKSGAYSSAGAQFRNALAGTSNPVEQAVIKFWLVNADEPIGNYAEAVSVLKEIAADKNAYSLHTRASAVQRMAWMFYRYGDPRITEEIFKDEPYSDFVVKGDSSLTYRHLFEYATSLYPLALSELYIANWYSSQLAKDPVSHPEYKEIIRQKIKLADSNLDQIRGDSTQAYMLVYSLERRAIIVGRMTQLGDTSFGDPEKDFADLLNLFSVYHLQYDATTRFQYAVYLARTFGTVRSTDIRDILAPLNEDYEAHGISFASFLRNERENRLGAKNNVILLASIDPKFKQLVISLGWTEADFK
ncbi:MAG: hypothetical protein Q7S50_02050 [bacterium]|nr:hypothetical protein [bacterium]